MAACHILFWHVQCNDGRLFTHWGSISEKSCLKIPYKKDLGNMKELAWILKTTPRRDPCDPSSIDSFTSLTERLHLLKAIWNCYPRSSFWGRRPASYLSQYSVKHVFDSLRLSTCTELATALSCMLPKKARKSFLISQGWLFEHKLLPLLLLLHGK